MISANDELRYEIDCLATKANERHLMLILTKMLNQWFNIHDPCRVVPIVKKLPEKYLSCYGDIICTIKNLLFKIALNIQVDGPN